MTDHPESDHGVLVDLPGARCEEILPGYTLGTMPWRCYGRLQVYSRARPRRVVRCASCGHVSYEVFTEDVA